MTIYRSPWNVQTRFSTPGKMRFTHAPKNRNEFFRRYFFFGAFILFRRYVFFGRGSFWWTRRIDDSYSRCADSRNVSLPTIFVSKHGEIISRNKHVLITRVWIRRSRGRLYTPCVILGCFVRFWGAFMFETFVQVPTRLIIQDARVV